MESLTQNILRQNMRELRKLNNLTQQQFGDLLGVSNTQISRYESGMDFPSPPMIDRMAGIFQVHIQDLFASDVAKLKKAEYKGASKADALIMLNKVLEEVGLAMVERKDRKKAG
jgi:transcriptional regulator with XRE-family HTH domain